MVGIVCVVWCVCVWCVCVCVCGVCVCCVWYNRPMIHTHHEQSLQLCHPVLWVVLDTSLGTQSHARETRLVRGHLIPLTRVGRGH